MLPFTVTGGLPESVMRFAETVRLMLSTVDIDPLQECYLMIDEADVASGECHRRPGLHVDGYWYPAAQCHGGEHPNPGHRPSPKPSPGKHSGVGNRAETVLLASNYEAAAVYTGAYERDFITDWRGGDCSDIDVSGLARIPLSAGRAYALDAFSLHESLPVRSQTRRTVVRINVPGLA